MRISDKFIFFYKENLSQWGKVYMTDPITNIRYSSCEQYMMANKALLFNDKETYNKIMKTDNPKIQQDLGRIVNNFDSNIWDAKKYEIVKSGNILKFTQNEYLKKQLLSYPKKCSFVEASPFDRVWGIGLSQDDFDADYEEHWLGQNLLGEVITEVRDGILKCLSFENNMYII